MNQGSARLPASIFLFTFYLTTLLRASGLTVRNRGMSMKSIMAFALLIISILFGPASPGSKEPVPDKEARPSAGTTAASPYLFVWAGDEDQKESDFLAVIDALPASPTYGQVVATLAVGARATGPHHTEYEFP